MDFTYTELKNSLNLSGMSTFSTVTLTFKLITIRVLELHFVYCIAKHKFSINYATLQRNYYIGSEKVILSRPVKYLALEHDRISIKISTVFSRSTCM